MTDALFVGLGSAVSGWYRAILPAMALGCDSIAARGEPDALDVRTALTYSGRIPEFDDYQAIVLQQVHGPKWLDEIKRLKAKGIRVVYEIDDYIHELRKVKDHAARDFFTRAKVVEHEICMTECDALIVSTEFLLEKYRRLNSEIFLCENAIDVPRYSRHAIPPRSTVNIGWAGGTGHERAVIPWLPVVERILTTYPETMFVTIGEPYARELEEQFGKRALPVPAAATENYPAVLTNFDIALAPSSPSKFHRAKSDLRFIEAAALQIPVVADPKLYKRVENRKTGLLASNPEQIYNQISLLIERPELRAQIGRNAFEYVERERNIETASLAWRDVLEMKRAPGSRS